LRISVPLVNHFHDQMTVQAHRWSTVDELG
jgi:hypothetical protein